MKIMISLVYCHMLNIPVHAEFHIPSKCQILVAVPDCLYCGKQEKKLKSCSNLDLGLILPDAELL